MHYYIADPPSRVDDGERVIERLTTNEDDPSPVDDMQAQIKGEGWLGFFLGMCPLIYTWDLLSPGRPLWDGLSEDLGTLMREVRLDT